MEKNNNVMFWLTMGVANALVLYIASMVFPTMVVLGNAGLSNFMAAILTAALLTVLLYLVKPVLQASKVKVKGNMAINITYGAANIVGLWVLAKMAVYTGFGITGFIVAIALGIVLSAVQFGIWKMIGEKAGNK